MDHFLNALGLFLEELRYSDFDIFVLLSLLFVTVTYYILYRFSKYPHIMIRALVISLGCAFLIFSMGLFFFVLFGFVGVFLMLIIIFAVVLIAPFKFYHLLLQKEKKRIGEEMLLTKAITKRGIRKWELAVLAFLLGGIFFLGFLYHIEHRAEAVENDETLRSYYHSAWAKIDYGLLVGIAQNAACPTDILEELSHHPSQYVRSGVAFNLRTPTVILTPLSKDANRWVRERAYGTLLEHSIDLSSPHAREEIIMKLDRYLINQKRALERWEKQTRSKLPSPGPAQEMREENEKSSRF